MSRNQYIFWRQQFIVSPGDPIATTPLLQSAFFSRSQSTTEQGGITCGAIDEPRKSSKAIDERVIINFRDKNVVIARFRDKNVYR